MRQTKTFVVAEIAVWLMVLLAVEWIGHDLTNTRQYFVPATVVLAVYLGVRMAISARKRRTSAVHCSH